MKVIVKTISLFMLAAIFLSSCSEEENLNSPEVSNQGEAKTSASYSEQVEFQTTQNSSEGMVYEILPGPAAINPSMDNTPFSDNTTETTGSYDLSVADLNEKDAADSEDSVKNVSIQFTGNDGQKYKINNINIIHKPEGSGDHTFFGGVGFNKIMHGSTGIGTNLMPKLLSYITLWGKTDLLDPSNGDTIAKDRLIHIMTTTNVRDKDKNLITNTDKDMSDYNIKKAHTHIMLPPKDMQGNKSPIPGTDHGFLHVMFEEVKLMDANRDWKKAFEILPGPAAINPDNSPTPFSNKIGIGAGNYNLELVDMTDEDAVDSQDSVMNVNIKYERPNGEVFQIDNIQIIHKATGTGDHTFFGGVGLNKTMHGNTGIGTNLMPKLKAYITLWGKTNLKDGQGNVIASDRLVHIMTTSRVRTSELMLITDTETDNTNHNKSETHIMLPPKDMQGNKSPVPGTGHGFLHLMFEEVDTPNELQLL